MPSSSTPGRNPLAGRFRCCRQPFFSPPGQHSCPPPPTRGGKESPRTLYWTGSYPPRGGMSCAMAGGARERGEEARGPVGGPFFPEANGLLATPGARLRRACSGAVFGGAERGACSWGGRSVGRGLNWSEAQSVGGSSLGQRPESRGRPFEEELRSRRGSFGDYVTGPLSGPLTPTLDLGRRDSNSIRAPKTV